MPAARTRSQRTTGWADRFERGAPYVGITGIVTPEDVETARAAFAATRQTSRMHRPMIGILASGKTLAGEPTPNRRYPPIHAVSALVNACASFAFTTLHFNTRRSAPLDEQIDALLRFAPAVHGIQLNVVRPDPRALARIRHRHPQIELILQVNGASLDAHRTQPVLPTVDAFVQDYAGIVDHALLDLSGGTGRGVDVTWAADCLATYARAWRATGITVGVAGGLGPDADIVLGALQHALGERHATSAVFSIDAESGVRVPATDPTPGERYQDALDPTKAAAYVAAAVAGLEPIP